jgi:hypothetical protein
VIYPVKASVLGIRRDVVVNNRLIDFIPRLSKVLNTVDIFVESVFHTLDAFRGEHCMCLCRVHSKVGSACFLLPKQKVGE